MNGDIGLELLFRGDDGDSKQHGRIDLGFQCRGREIVEGKLDHRPLRSRRKGGVIILPGQFRHRCPQMEVTGLAVPSDGCPDSP